MGTNKTIEVLLFDNNPIERELISEIYTNMDCKVTAVARRLDSISLVERKKYNLIIVDQILQENYINDFIDKLSEIYPLTPVAMMVTVAGESLAAAYGKLNVDFLISRPFGYRELKSLLKEAIILSKSLNK